MKQTIKTGLGALVLLLAISCKKEGNTIQSSGITSESSTQADIADINVSATIASVKIGTQVWMKRNLNVSRYRNGDIIPQVRNKAKWAALTTGAWCWYNNDSANGPIYGKLYNWYAVHDPRGLAPAGWHVPTDTEWITLTTFLGGDAVAGGEMKEKGTTHWLAPNTGATNSSGFTGLPGGYRVDDGTFDNIGYFGYWWSSTEANTPMAWHRYLGYDLGTIQRSFYYKEGGFSVRCLRD